MTRTALRTELGLWRNFSRERTIGRGSLTSAERRARTISSPHPARVKNHSAGVIERRRYVLIIGSKPCADYEAADAMTNDRADDTPQGPAQTILGTAVAAT